MTRSAIEGEAELSDLRREIDEVDAAMVRLLARRLAVVDRVIGIKRGAQLPARIPDRVELVVRLVRGEAEKAGAPPELTEHLWREMMDWVIAYEDRRLAESPAG